MGKDSAARIELGRSFHQMGTVNEKVSESDVVPLDFKIVLITYKALNGLAPQYLSELLSHYSPPRLLRSQNSGPLIIPRISKSTAGGRSFFYLAPKLWKNLPLFGRQTHSVSLNLD